MKVEVSINSYEDAPGAFRKYGTPVFIKSTTDRDMVEIVIGDTKVKVLAREAITAIQNATNL